MMRTGRVALLNRARRLAGRAKLCEGVRSDRRAVAVMIDEVETLLRHLNEESAILREEIKRCTRQKVASAAYIYCAHMAQPKISKRESARESK
jgi:hypothetical protein